MVGNRTEGALLILLRSWGRNYKTVREQRHDDIANLYGFSSAKKMASVMLKIDGGLRLYNKVHHTASLLRQDAKHGIYICLGCFKVAASVMLKMVCACSINYINCIQCTCHCIYLDPTQNSLLF